MWISCSSRITCTPVGYGPRCLLVLAQPPWPPGRGDCGADVTSVVGLPAAAPIVTSVPCSFSSVTFPLDLTKTRLQVQGEAAVHRNGAAAGQAVPYRGMLRTAAGIVQEEGLRKLWQGATPAVYRHIGDYLLVMGQVWVLPSVANSLLERACILLYFEYICEDFFSLPCNPTLKYMGFWFNLFSSLSCPFLHSLILASAKTKYNFPGVFAGRSSVQASTQSPENNKYLLFEGSGDGLGKKDKVASTRMKKCISGLATGHSFLCFIWKYSDSNKPQKHLWEVLCLAPAEREVMQSRLLSVWR